jgi:uncharacterized protein YdhG (YjbR/CyaY superfamily)
MATPVNVEAYIEALPADRRIAVETLRQTIRAAAPEALESIAYAMPAFRTRDGQFLVSYAAFKNHYSLFPADEAIVKALGHQITPYVAGKGTIQFPAGSPIPTALVSKVVAVRLAELEARPPRSSSST